MTLWIWTFSSGRNLAQFLLIICSSMACHNICKCIFAGSDQNALQSTDNELHLKRCQCSGVHFCCFFEIQSYLAYQLPVALLLLKLPFGSFENVCLWPVL